MLTQLNAVDQLKYQITQCQSCHLRSGADRGPMPFFGTGSSEIMFVTDSPGKEENRNGIPFAARDSWAIMSEAFITAGFTQEFIKGAIRTNAVKCHQPREDFDGNTCQETLDCGFLLDEEIRMFKPKIIVAFGAAAAYRFSPEYIEGKIQKGKKVGGILEKHGLIEWSFAYQCWVMFMFSPRYVVRNPAKKSVFIDAMVKLKTFIDNGYRMPEQSLEVKYSLIYPKPSYDPEEEAKNLSVFFDEATRFFKWLATQPEWSLDLETTGFDWWTDQVLMIAVSWRKGRAAAVEFHSALLPALQEALASPAGKCMQNGKFDLKFLKFQLGLTVNNYDFDTQLAAHHLDENSYVGLDELESRYLGIEPYKGQFWKEKAEFDKRENKTLQEIIEFKEKFMKYACQDADFTLRLKHIFLDRLPNPQNEPIAPPIERSPYAVFKEISMPMTQVIATMEKNGLKFSEPYQLILEQKLRADSEQIQKEAKKILYNILFPDMIETSKRFYEDGNILWAELKNYFDNVKSEKQASNISDIFKHIENISAYLKACFREDDNEVIKENYRKAIFYIQNVEGKNTRRGLRPLIQKVKTAIKKEGYDIVFLEQFLEKLEGYNEWLGKVVDFDANLGSPKEMSFYLYQVIGLPIISKTKSGDPSTDKETMEALATKHPFPNLIVQYRGVEHDISNYIDAIRRARHPFDNRVHPSFSQTGTITGRLNCKEPPLHGIKRTFEIRNSVVPEKGNLIIEGDLSQAEIRFLAAMSQDQNLIDAFRAGGDIHEENARRIFKIPPEQKPTKEQRAITKRIVFAILYGAAVASIAESLEITVREAQEYFDKFYAVYPRTKQWMEEMHTFCEKNGYVVNYYGRIRRLPGIWSSNKGQRNEALRQSINAPIQGGATGDYVAKVHIKVQQWLDEEFPNGEVKQIHNHHDAILLEAPIPLARYVCNKLTEIAENADESLGVPIVFDCEVTNCWGGVGLSDEEIEEYTRLEQEDNLPTHGYCQHHMIDKENKPIFENGQPVLCNNLFLPATHKHNKCPDHWMK